MDYKPTLRKSGQVAQDNVAYGPEGNGWPDALNDGGPQVRQAITNGKNGEVTTMDEVSTSQQKLKAFSLPEGPTPTTAMDTEKYYKSDATANHGDPLKTSQQIAGEISDPGGSDRG